MDLVGWWHIEFGHAAQLVELSFCARTQSMLGEEGAAQGWCLAETDERIP